MKKQTAWWFFLTVTVILSLSFCAFSAYDGCESYTGSNIGAHNYINAARWSKPVESYLVPASGSRLMRFQYVAGEKKMLAEYYSSDLTFIERKVIAPELPIFGGFYAFNNYYYILTGQKNPDESDGVEVFRVTKYDQNWKRLAAASLKGCNTTVPFEAGSARFAHSGKYLLIRTCHEMYRSSDGYHHQANVTIQIDTSTMTVTDEMTDVSNNAYGYISHSFNQFIGVDDGKIVAVDHGDAYPRSIALTKYSTALSSGSFGSSSGKCKVYDMLKISGSIGDNDTYCTVGGFVISDKGYLVAGSARKSAGSTAQNIYISYLPKNSNTPALKWLTDYTDASVSNPHLVTMGAGRWLLLWQKGENVFYTEITASGDTVGQIYHLEGDLSDCAPVVFGGKLVWYTWKDGNITFYSISPASLAFPQTKELNFGHDYVPNGSASQGKINLRCRVCGSVKTGTVPVDFMIYWPASGNWYTSQPKSSYHPDSRIDIVVKYTAKDFNEYVVESSDSSVVKVNKDGSLLTGKEGSAKVIVRSKYSSAVCEEYRVVVSHNIKRTVQSKPTCTLQGKTLVKCTECSYSVTEITEALGHAFGESVQTKKPTCTAPGTKKKTCSVCGETVVEDIPATGHSEITVSAVAPTCTKSGKTAGKKCSVCGTTTVVQETVPALGHHLGTYKVTKKATCTAMGKETATCSRCDYEKSRDIEKTPHS
ncbi:MAG: hypothetical protein PUC33_06770, partial [Oscillospiraceae bacterium]|nr:hypothetical protein [Oscillospiraceae bacterium]